MELSNEQRPPESRMMAGLLLKNILTSREESKKQQLSQQWMQLNGDVKTQVKLQICKTLHSKDDKAYRVAAQTLARLSVIELSAGNWTDVIDELSDNVVKPKSQSGMVSSLMCMGYICEECDAEALVKKAHLILTAVIAGMKNTQYSEMRSAGISAFLNALNFFGKNFEVQKERDVIMGAVCACTQDKDINVRRTAMESLVAIVNRFYHVMKTYMEAIFKISANCIQNDQPEVSLQAIEIWSSLSETEHDIMDDIEYCKEMQQDCKQVMQGFVSAAVRLKLGDLLTISLTKQQEGQTEEDWNISAAASTCLQLVTNVVGPQIAEAIMPFIAQHLASTDWHFKEAATLAFSAIIEIPNEQIGKLLDQNFSVFLQNLSHKVVLVKDTSVFMLGRIARFHVYVIKKNIENYIKAMVYCLEKEQPRIASKAAWSLYNFAEAFPTNEQDSDLGKYFGGVMQTLLAAADRKDANQVNLRINVYAAISGFINIATPDLYKNLEGITGMFCKKIEGILKNQTNITEEKEEQVLIISCICGALQALVTRLGQAIGNQMDTLMTLLLSLLKHGGFGDEVFLVIASIITVTGSSFERYIRPFSQFLYQGLTNFKEEQICLTCVTILVDLCTNMEEKIEPFCNDIMKILLSDLQNPQLGKTVKVEIISVFGDIALAIGPKFERFLSYVAQVLKQASDAQVDPKNEELVQYIYTLREKVLSAYVGILSGFKSSPQPLIPYIDPLLSFLKRIGSEEDIDTEIFTHAVSIVGDLSHMYGAKIKQFLANDIIIGMVDRAKKSKDPKIQSVGKYARKALDKIL